MGNKPLSIRIRQEFFGVVGLRTVVSCIDEDVVSPREILFYPVHFVGKLLVIDMVFFIHDNFDIAPIVNLSYKRLWSHVDHERWNWVAKRTDCRSGHNRGQVVFSEFWNLKN